MNVTTFGIDLAKNVFQVHGADARGKAVIRRQLKRDEVIGYFANQPPSLIGMEACGSAHHWARELQQLGHTVKLMAPQFVKPYVKSNKNDRADAQAICEAVGRPSMRFVPIKSVEQQSVLALHRARQGFVKERTAQGNQIRGLLAEFGVSMPVGIGQIARGIPRILGDADNGLPERFRALLARLYEHFQHLHTQVIALEREIKAWHAQNAVSQRAAQVPGVGPITASALVELVPNRGAIAVALGEDDVRHTFEVNLFANAEFASCESDLARLHQEMMSTLDAVREWTAANPVCPTCGATVDAERLMTWGHAHG